MQKNVQEMKSGPGKFLNKIAIFLTGTFAITIVPHISHAAECADYAAMLETCKPYTCTFIHPMTKASMEKKIVGEKDGQCLTTEQMPPPGRMECAYNLETRKAVAQYTRTLSAGKETTSSTTTIAKDGSSKTTTTYTINGKTVDNPLQEALDGGQCNIVGYD